MQIKVKELHLKGSNILPQNGDIYKKLGLGVRISGNSMYISSTDIATVKGVNHCIHVELNSITYLEKIMEEGFYSKDDHNKMPLEIVDDLGNKILVFFNPRCNIRRISVLTSGGDAPGMNPAIRAVVRTGIKWGSVVYGIYSGYEGLINDNIEELNWSTVDFYNSDGGTFLLSARSKNFMNREGRKKAVFNLVKRKIEGLIVMGGDGSMKGAYIFQQEFKTLTDELIKEGTLPADTVVYDLHLVCIPASIDNDIPFADTIIGSDSALHRVIECVDNLMFTMESHRRAFVIEVMGRNCGWIALMSSLATSADFFLLPESPVVDWEKKLLKL